MKLYLFILFCLAGLFTLSCKKKGALKNPNLAKVSGVYYGMYYHYRYTDTDQSTDSTDLSVAVQSNDDNTFSIVNSFKGWNYSYKWTDSTLDYGNFYFTGDTILSYYIHNVEGSAHLHTLDETYMFKGKKQ